MKPGTWLGLVVACGLVVPSVFADDLLGRSRGRDTGGSSGGEQTRSSDRTSRNGAPPQERSRAEDRGRTLPPIQDRARGEDRARRGGNPPTEDRGRALPPVQDRARGEDAIRRGDDSNGRHRDAAPPRVIVGPYGVYDPRTRSADGGSLLGRTRDSGSRSVYGTVTNARANVVDIRDLPPATFRRAPIDLFRGPLAHQALRESVEIRTSNLRIGYVHYDSRWRDDDFFYAYYEFRPHPDRCTVSPWYYYPHLPGYIRVGRVVILQPVIAIYPGYDWYYPWRNAVVHGWSRPSWVSDRYRYSEIDWAVDDLVAVFERRDRRALDRLLPRGGKIGVWIDERFAYALSPDDFYDLMLDNAFGTRTRRYDILEVRRWRDQIRVLARHDYEDPWGRLDCVYHTYRLEPEGRGYVIVDFGSSAFRPRL
ncbi:MAG: hypothetical protein N2109_07395 [Fimbriimonadales bacterium]|nr:hypothetical protein [Fimbriimonadales bacterium]